MTLILGIGVTAVGLAVIAAIIRKVIRGDTGADDLFTVQGRRYTPPPRSPNSRKRGW